MEKRFSKTSLWVVMCGLNSKVKDFLEEEKKRKEKTIETKPFFFDFCRLCFFSTKRETERRKREKERKKRERLRKIEKKRTKKREEKERRIREEKEKNKRKKERRKRRRKELGLCFFATNAFFF